MSLSSINGSASNAYMAQAAAQQAKAVKAPQLPTNTTEQTATQKPNEPEDNAVKSFAYSALGMDKPNEVKDNDDGAYTAGQVLTAIGTVGSIIAIMV
ncbi:hypothetical protein F9L16_10105 [Agarivorans sp. B2Z047]|uniref:hypothetical protein n=1 Tax=Agarivorans sp. B2Z047 TaxID=2652721 RepID=UPI00128CB5EF|nr:hypothetical protein [Agarivorans sp. B2Z047]MPW29349.1 hypothetical protein [Agarivorans sp. B2Z047]UQN44937.1 hypothetical protein LQZ07_10870 [Agarivorans sp. B2Z047]